MSSFTGLYTGLSGIQAAQRGLDITTHNVANASTPGYTRQRVELTARPSFQSPNGQIGTGVDVESIARLRDGFLDDRFRAAIGEQAESSIRAEFHESLEFLSGEPDNGLTNRIDKLWGAAEEWSNDPDDSATRRQVLSELASLADGFQATARAWQELGLDTEARRDVVVGQANDILGELDAYNRQLANADPSRVGSELLDERDQLIDQLAQLVGSTSQLQEDGSVTVTLGDTELLSLDEGAASFTTDTVEEGAVGVILAGAEPGDDAADVTEVLSGELGGLNRAIETDLPEWLGQLDALATSFAGAINEINQYGLDAEGRQGEALFASSDPDDEGILAGTIMLVTEDIDDLAAATGEEQDPPEAPAPFDGSNARALADLRTTRIDAAGEADGEGATIESQLADLVVGLGAAVRSSRSNADAAKGVASGAGLARDAEHGVSIDEEMVGLVRYQRSLEAAARIMTTVDQTLDTLVNRVGIVGR